jgi:hypothetical protein
MAFEIHKSRLPEDPNINKNSNQNHPSSNDIEDVPFCIPADGIFKTKCKWDPVAETCHALNCDALFTLPELRQAQKSWSSTTTTSSPKVIISCGPERSGSTWLFNAIRLLHQNCHQPLDSYWLKTVTDKTLDDRLPGSSYRNNSNRHHVLIKTHAWSGDKFDLSRATHIFVTHRDLRQVLASYRRMHWEYELPVNYVKDHMKWKDVATRDFAFELIIDRPRDVLLQLADDLGIRWVLTSEALDKTLEEVSSLAVPTDWVDPVSQIWPNHLSQEYLEQRRSGGKLGEAMQKEVRIRDGKRSHRLDDEEKDELLRRFPEFYQYYGYGVEEGKRKEKEGVLVSGKGVGFDVLSGKEKRLDHVYDI